MGMGRMRRAARRGQQPITLGGCLMMLAMLGISFGTLGCMLIMFLAMKVL